MRPSKNLTSSIRSTLDRTRISVVAVGHPSQVRSWWSPPGPCFEKSANVWEEESNIFYNRHANVH